jgi:hypothetical protein
MWVLDDITPLRQMAENVGESGAHLFRPRETIRVLPGIDWSSSLAGKNYLGGSGGAFTETKTPEGAAIRKYLDVGQNPPAGAIVTY